MIIECEGQDKKVHEDITKYLGQNNVFLELKKKLLY